MIKTVDSGFYELGDPAAAVVKVASAGVRGEDRRAFFKRASAGFLLPQILADLRPGEVPVHQVALGAYEKYGLNRNADGFTEATCERCHPTFAKFARVYRDHDNTPTSRHYGRVLASAYNEAMSRVELISALYGTKEAADRGGGYVADRELEKLYSGKDKHDSMACKIAFDCCLSCGNRAAHRGEYCDTRPVKLASGRVIPACRHFGCRTGLTKVADDGFVQGVDNPDPLTWFDISDVGQPADRIATAIGLLEKAAAAGEVEPSARVAARYGIHAPIAAVVEGLPANLRQKAARRLALAGELARCVPVLFPPRLMKLAIACPAAAPEAMRALADRGCVLGLGDWYTVCTGKAASHTGLGQVAARLPGVFGRIAADPDWDIVSGLTRYEPDPHARVETRVWAEKTAAVAGVLDADRSRLCAEAVVRGASAPRPPVLDLPADACEKLARQYAWYQLAALDSLAADDAARAQAARWVVARNQSAEFV